MFGAWAVFASLHCHRGDGCKGRKRAEINLLTARPICVSVPDEFNTLALGFQTPFDHIFHKIYRFIGYIDGCGRQCRLVCFRKANTNPENPERSDYECGPPPVANEAL